MFSSGLAHEEKWIIIRLYGSICWHKAAQKTKVSTMNFNVQAFAHPCLLARSLLHRIRSDVLLRNSMYIMGTNVVTAGFGYVFWIVAAHTYSAYNVGLAAAFISIMLLASALSNLGIGSTMVQMLPRREAGHAWSLTLNAGVAIAIVTGLLTGVIVVVVLPLFSQQFAIVEHQLGYAITLIVGVPFMTLSLLLDQVFVAERVARNMLLRNLIVATLKIPLMAVPVLLLARVGALGIFSSYVLATAISLLGGMLLVLRLRRAYRLSIRGIVKQIRSMLSSLAGHHFINLGGLTPTYLLPVIVAAMLSPSENAYYYTTAKLSDFFFMSSSSVAVALFAEGSHSAGDLSSKVRSSIKAISMFLIPSMIILFVVGYYVMLLFGPGYAQHGLLLLRILIIAAVPDAITNIYVSVLRVQKRLRFAAALNLSMATLDLSFAWILLPIQGIAGAGWSFLIAQGVGSLVAGADAFRIYRLRRRTHREAMQSDVDQVETQKLSSMKTTPRDVDQVETQKLPSMKTTPRDVDQVETQKLPSMKTTPRDVDQVETQKLPSMKTTPHDVDQVETQKLPSLAEELFREG